MFAALAVPNFRRYVSGQALSLIGTWVETVAQALLVLRLTHSGTILGLTTAARYAPILILSPYAGLLVDRYAKRHVLLATQTGLGLVSAALGVSVLTGGVRLWQVIVLALLFGTLSAVDNPARQAFVQEVVGQDLVRDAVTLNTTTVNVARVIGPTIAAVLVATIGIGWCFIVNAVSFGFVIASLLSLDIPRLHPVPPVRRSRGQLRAGLRYAAAVPDIARPLLMMALVGTFTFEFETSLPLLAEKTFHGGATTYSWLIGALGAGAIVGGLYAARSGRTGVAGLTRAALFYAIAVGLVAAAPSWPAASPPASWPAQPLSPSSLPETPPSSSPPSLITAAGSSHCGRWPWSAARPSARRSSACSPTWPGRGTRSPSAPSPASQPWPSAAGRAGPIPDRKKTGTSQPVTSRTFPWIIEARTQERQAAVQPARWQSAAT